MTSPSAFRVPADLAALDLTLTEVREILDNRRARKSVQARLDGIPERAKRLHVQLEELDQKEAELMQAAATRRG